MKIGFAVGYFDPQVGGSEEVVKRLATGLKERGHDVTVATSRHPARVADDMAVPVIEFECLGNATTGMAGDLLGYQRFLLESDRDVWLFYAAQIWTTDAALAIFRSMSSRCVVVPCGYSALHNPLYSSYFDALKALLSHADALVYMSSGYQDFTHDAEAGLSELMHIIPNGAASDEFVAPSAPTTGAGRTVITVANHYYDKGHGAVIRAFREAAGPTDRLVIVGEAPSTDPRATCWWQCRLAALRDRRISLMRGLARDEVVAQYGAADIFLFGSRVECAPLVIIEAMAAGIPFLSTPVGNVADYADAGVITDESRLGAELRRLLDDPALAAALGASGRARWERDHRWEAVVDAYESLFDALIDGG